MYGRTQSATLADMNDVLREAPLRMGTPAPEFDLPTGPDTTLGLTNLRGRPAVLAFYPADWSPVCSDQMVLYQEVRPMFDEFNAQILGISVDGVWCHRAFARHRGIEYPLLADFEPKGAVSRAFGAFRSAEGVSERALFVLDREGTVHWSYLSPIDVNPGADGVLRALQDLTRREARA
jgi:peroxiredoxin